MPNYQETFAAISGRATRLRSTPDLDMDAEIAAFTEELQGIFDRAEIRPTGVRPPSAAVGPQARIYLEGDDVDRRVGDRTAAEAGTEAHASRGARRCGAIRSSARGSSDSCLLTLVPVVATFVFTFTNST